MAYLTSTERRREAEKAALQSEKHSVAAAASVPTRFKDLVEKSAEENGFLFIPIPNRRHDGKAVYSFGKCLGDDYSFQKLFGPAPPKREGSYVTSSVSLSVSLSVPPSSDTSHH